jgi:protocatechuate 3,4-dioxygenase beta subunit
MKEGLARDLELLDRRRLLGWMGAAVCFPFAACSERTSAASATCSPIPQETAGPFPADGANGPNVLNLSGIVRSDIRSSFGDMRGTAEGLPMTIKFKVVGVRKGCAPLAGAAVYVWECDRSGRYSLYSVRDQNYLRGVQVADAEGNVTFQSIFPAAYFGRWPHVHFEVFPTLAEASKASGLLATSQIAMPRELCEEAFAHEGYEQSRRNLSRMSIARDNVFSDGVALETPTVTGRMGSGLTVALDVAV